MGDDRTPRMSTPTLLVLLFVASIAVVFASVLLVGPSGG